jgi:hypothetical protein
MSTSGALSSPAAAAAPTPGTTQVTPPPAAPGAAATPGQVGSGPTSAADLTPGSWMAGFSDDDKGYIANKGFKGPKDVFDSYRNLEKMRGVPAERQLNMPEKMRGEDGKLTPEGRAFLERVGTPKDMKDYNITIPKEMGDPKMADVFRQKFFEMGMPAEMAQETVNSWNSYMTETANAAKEQQVAAFREQDGKLKTEWGAAYDQNKVIAAEGVRNLGLDSKQVDALSGQLGHAETMKLLAKLGKHTGEGAFHAAGSGNNGPLEPSQARAQRDALMADPGFRKKFAANDAEAIAKWTRLNQMIAPGVQEVGRR